MRKLAGVTNGKQFRHPDAEAIARVIRYGGSGVKLHFNYHTEFNDMWVALGLQRKHGYSTRYPANDYDGLSLELQK